MHYSSNKDIARIVAQLVRDERWIFLRRRKHGVLVAPSGRKIAVPGTPSDHRAIHNLANRLRQIREGCTSCEIQ